MFNVLVLAYYFPPLGLSGVQRTLKFVKYLPANGWKPTVVTCEPGAYYAFDETLLDDIKDKDVEIHRVKGKEINSRMRKKGVVEMPPEFIRKTLKFISSIFYVTDNKKSWSVQAYQYCRKMMSENKYDLIFISGPPFSMFEYAALLKTEFDVPLIIDYRDLWLGNHFAIYTTPLHKSLNRKKEYEVLKSADKIIVTNRKIKERLMEYYQFLKFPDVTILPHGYDPEDFNNNPQNITLEKGYFHLTYSGIFYEHITPKYFLEAFRMIADEKPEAAKKMKLHFAGILRKENRKLITRLGLSEYVVEHGYLNHTDAVGILKSSSALWFMVGEGKNSDTISSGKMFEYIGSGKPILACLADGALKSTLQEYNAAVIVPTADVLAIKNAILSLYSDFQKSSLAEGSTEFRDKFRRDYLTDILAKEFNAALRV